jgi:hypothetical protein
VGALSYGAISIHLPGASTQTARSKKTHALLEGSTVRVGCGVLGQATIFRQAGIGSNQTTRCPLLIFFRPTGLGGFPVTPRCYVVILPCFAFITIGRDRVSPVRIPLT